VRPPNAEQTNVQKKALMDNLSRDLDRARGKRNALAFKRDALASDVTTLTAQIAELEARLSEEKDRRERERIGGEIEGIKKRLKETATAFAPVIAGLCDATEAAAAVIPEARELNSFLLSVATEVDIVIDSLLRELQRQTEALRTGNTALDLPQSVIEAPELPKKNDRLLLLPAWLGRNKEAGKKESGKDRLSTAA
jgi:chromosome segregation ATPase